MNWILILASLAFSLPVAMAFRAYGPRAMIIAGTVNFMLYMIGIWLLGGFS